MVLIFVALAGLAYLGFTYVMRGAPHPTVSDFAKLPGATVSKLTHQSGNVQMLLLIAGGAVVVLFIARAMMSSNK